MISTKSIARKIPDLPRWVELRDCLLLGDCEILGLEEKPELSFVIQDASTESVFIIGMPLLSAVQAAVEQGTRGGIVAPQETTAAWLAGAFPKWSRAQAILHLLPDSRHLPVDSAGNVAFLDPDKFSRYSLPPDLLEELVIGAEHSPIAASFVDNKPVSFCYAGAITESLWDVAIDTLPEHRRQGHAALSAAYMIRYMYSHGKQPVWAALEENPASWQLARKLGFVVVDEIALFEQGE